MARSTSISRRFAIGLAALAVTLGGVLLQPAAALAGFSTSPGSATVAYDACTSGKHMPDATLL